jgi:hypothetical protein
MNARVLVAMVQRDIIDICDNLAMIHIFNGQWWYMFFWETMNV